MIFAGDEDGVEMVNHQFSFCSPNQSIRDAILRIEKEDPEKLEGKHVLVNIGASDIFNGAEFDEMIRNFFELIEACELAGMVPIITTILPIAKMDDSSCMLMTKVSQFNGFLNEAFNDVIDLLNCYTMGLSRQLATLIQS